MKQLLEWFKHLRWFRWTSIILVSAVGLYALLGFLVLPRLVTHFAPKIGTDYLKRDLRVADMRLNPFSFELELTGASLKETNGEPLAAFDRLFVNLDPFRSGAWTVAELSLEKPAVRLVMAKDNTLNLARIADDLPPSEPDAESPGDEPMPAVLVERLALSEGTVEYIDQTKAEPAKASVGPFSLSVTGLSTLPETDGTPHFSADIEGGGKLDWQGKLGLNPVRSDGEIKLTGVKLALPWRFARDLLNLTEPGGDIGIAGHYTFALEGSDPALTVDNIHINLAALSLALADDPTPLLTLQQFDLSEARFDLKTQQVDLPKITLADGKLSATLAADGLANWQRLMKPSTGTPAPAPEPPKPAPEPQKTSQPSSPPGAATTPAAAPAARPASWKIKVGALDLKGLGIDVRDESRRKPITLGIDRVTLHAAADLDAGATTQLLINEASLGVQGIDLAQDGLKQALAHLDVLEVKDTRFDLAEQRVSVGSVALTGGSTRVTHKPDGTIDLAAAFEGGGKTSAAAPEAAPAKPASDAKPWQYAIDQITLGNFAIALTDAGYSPAIQYMIRDLDAAVKHIASDGKTPIQLTAQLQLDGGGGLKVDASAGPQFDRADAGVQLDQFDLRPLQPVVTPLAKLKLESGKLSSRLKLGFNQGKRGPELKVIGTANLSSLMLREIANGKPFLAWKAVDLDGMEFNLDPLKLAIKEIRVADPLANVEVYKDQSSNVSAIFDVGPTTAKPAAAAATPPPATEAKPKKPAEPPKGQAKNDAFGFTIGRVKVDRGQFDFADEALVIPFATHVRQIGGSLTNISSILTDRTQIHLEGRIDEYGEFKAEGGLSPLQFKAFSDVSVAFRNVDMSSLSPYSGTFAGRKIKNGKLNVELTFQTNQGKLKNNNTVILDKLELGEQVESPRAVSLPLDLAIALLTDGDGRISASVPVEGDVDNPEFSYGKVAWDALKTLITTAVTAPFRALSGLFGGGDENVGTLLFDPGRGDMAPPEREKVLKVVSVLSKRPQLQLEIQPHFDPEVDGHALRTLVLRRIVAEKLGYDVDPNEDPGPVAFDNAKSQFAIEQIADDRKGFNADALAAEFERTEKVKVERIGRIGAMTNRPSKTSQFYGTLFDRLVDTTPLQNETLAQLATTRAKAVHAELIKASAALASRVKFGKADAAKADGGRIPVKLELGAAGG